MTPPSDLWTPTREWEGADAFLIGGGPSLKNFDFSLLEGKNVIGCNDAYHLGPTIVSICVFGDQKWWQRNKWKLETFPNRIVTNSPSLLAYRLPTNFRKMIRLHTGFSHGGDALAWNYSTGALAINLAVILGAKRIFLLGYDLGVKGAEHHWHDHNPEPIKESVFTRFIGGFQTVKQALPKEIEVFNVTDGSSNLKIFPTMDFTKFIGMLKTKVVSEDEEEELENTIHGKQITRKVALKSLEEEQESNGYNS